MANVMANAALFEQMLMSGSTAMIFLTLDTARCVSTAVRLGQKGTQDESTHVAAVLCLSPPCEA